MGVLPLGFAPKCQRGRDIIAFEDLSTSGPHFFGLGDKKGSVVVNRNFARTPDPRVPQSPELHVSAICQFPGSTGIPPPAALTSVKCNGFFPVYFLLPPIRHLSSFLFFTESSPLFVCNLPPLCPLLALPSPRPPHLPETGAAEPAAFGGPRTRRKFPAGSLRDKGDPGGTFAEPQQPRKMGALPLGFGPKVPEGSEHNSFRGPGHFRAPFFWTWRKKRGPWW